MHNHQPSAACVGSPTFGFDWLLHIGCVPRSPSHDHFSTSVFEALACSLYSAYTQPFEGSPQCGSPPSRITWLRFLAWTHKRPSPATPVCLRVLCSFSSVFFRVLYIHLAILGPSLLIPTTAWQYPPSSTIFLLRVMSFPRIFTRFRLSSTYFGFTPDDVRLPLSGAGFRTHFSCTCPLQLPLPASVQRLTLPRGI